MARVFGRNVGLWTAGSLGLVTIGPLAVFSPSAAALCLAAAGSLGAGTAWARISKLNARCEKLSQEVDVLSQRLLKAEAAPPRPAADAAPPDTLRSEVHELTVEIGLLSGIVRDLSAVIRSQDDEIAALKTREVPVAKEPPPPPEPKPQPAPPPPPAPAPVETSWTPPVIARLPELPAVIAPPVPRPIPPRPPKGRAAPTSPRSSPPSIATCWRSYLQPIVTLPQRKVVAYEALARLRVEDQPLDTTQYLPALERNGRTTELDRRMLARTGTIVRHLASAAATRG